ncbi:Uncharacterised protein [Bordetella pertussis]|nr:Uncharacterised protein [Bordetella pertussis]
MSSCARVMMRVSPPCSGRQAGGPGAARVSRPSRRRHPGRRRCTIFPRKSP